MPHYFLNFPYLGIVLSLTKIWNLGNEKRYYSHIIPHNSKQLQRKDQERVFNYFVRSNLRKAQMSGFSTMLAAESHYLPKLMLKRLLHVTDSRADA